MKKETKMTFLIIVLLVINLAISVYVLINHQKAETEKHSAVRFIFKNGMGQRIEKMTLKVNESLPLAIEAQDKFGNKVTDLDSAPVWSIADETLGALVVEAGGLSASFKPSGKIGSTQIQVTGNDGSNEFVGTLALDLIAGDAVTMVIQPGTPVAETAPVEPPAPAPVEPAAASN